MWQQACSFVLRLCGGEKEKEKKEKISSFVACVTVGLKLVVLYYACGAAGELVVCFMPVRRPACGFVMPVRR